MSRPRNVVMTGGTAGIGAVAARRIAAAPGARLILGARRGEGADHLPLDLADLDSVRAFCAQVVDHLGGQGIDILVLNAGMNFAPEGARSAQGYELTFAVNHLAHHLLLSLLDPHLRPSGRVLVTTSDAHDPAINRVAPPHHADAGLLAQPVSDPCCRGSYFRRAMYAYSASKLCNLLMARTYQALPTTRDRSVSVVAYNPGLTLGTELGRTMPWGQRILTAVAGRVLAPILGLPSVETAGAMLAGLALGDIEQPARRDYASLVRGELRWPESSKLAEQANIGAALWAAIELMTRPRTDDAVQRSASLT